MHSDIVTSGYTQKAASTYTIPFGRIQQALRQEKIIFDERRPQRQSSQWTTSRCENSSKLSTRDEANQELDHVRRFLANRPDPFSR